MTVMRVMLSVRDLVDVLKDVKWRKMEYNDMKKYRGMWSGEAQIGTDLEGHTWVMDGMNLSRYVGDREYCWEISTLGSLFKV